MIRDNNVGLGVVGAAGNGVYMDQGTGNLILGANRIANHQNAGVLVTESPPATETRNVDIQFNELLNNTSGVNMFSGPEDILVFRNTFNDRTPGDDPDQGCQIRISDTAEDIVIDDNTLLNSPFSGICCEATPWG